MCQSLTQVQPTASQPEPDFLTFSNYSAATAEEANIESAAKEVYTIEEMQPSETQLLPPESMNLDVPPDFTSSTNLSTSINAQSVLPEEEEGILPSVQPEDVDNSSILPEATTPMSTLDSKASPM